MYPMLILMSLATAPELVGHERDPRTHALTPNDAVLVIPDVTGKVVQVGDLDGDGHRDLLLESGGHWRRSERIDAVSGRSGAPIRNLWTWSPQTAAERAWNSGGVWRSSSLTGARCDWDAGADLDGDGVDDLLLGFPNADGAATRAGRVIVVSGANGATLLELWGDAPYGAFGVSVAFVQDINGDGRSDFVVGAAESGPGTPFFDGESTGSTTSFDGGRETTYIEFADGRCVEERSYYQQRLNASSDCGGFVSARSGCDGSEIWRAAGREPGHAFGSFVFAEPPNCTKRANELLVQSDLKSLQPVRVLSTLDGSTLASITIDAEAVGWSGDLDGDGRIDFHLDKLAAVSCHDRVTGASFRSRATSKQLFRLDYPDWGSDYGVTAALGDVDGDGIDDIAFGEANFNLNGPNSPGGDPSPPEVAQLSLVQALALKSDPWCAFTPESGCAVVHSGRTQKVIFGVWALPGSRQGLGLHVTAVDDLSSDGMPDILITDLDTAYIFAGPGRVPTEAGK